MNEVQLLTAICNELVIIANSLGASPTQVSITGSDHNECDLLRIQINLLKVIVALV